MNIANFLLGAVVIVAAQLVVYGVCLLPEPWPRVLMFLIASWGLGIFIGMMKERGA